MAKYRDSGKAYHVKKAKSNKRKNKRVLRKQINEARKKGNPTIALELLLMLED